MRDWKGNLNKWKVAGVVTLGIVSVSGWGYGMYSGFNFVKDKTVEAVQAVVFEPQLRQEATLKQMAIILKQNGMEAKQLQQTMVNMKQSTESNSHMLYTVTGEKGTDGYYQTVNSFGQEVWLTDIETERLSLVRGDRVEMVVNQFGEVVSLKKVTN